MNPNPSCEDVLAQARGDRRDAEPLRLHLVECLRCREDLAEVRAIAHVIKTALLPQPDADGAAPLAARARSREVPAPALPAWSLLAAAALVAGVAFLTWRAGQPASAPAPAAVAQDSPPPPRAPRRQAAEVAPVVLEVRAPANGRLPYVIEGPAGARTGEVDWSDGYSIETVPAEEDGVVIDTF